MSNTNMRGIEISNEYPVELTAPDITPYRKGNIGADYITTFDSGQAGPHAMVSAIVHGNEPCGAIALDWLHRKEVRPIRGKLSLAFINTEAYSRFDPEDPNATRWIDEDFNRLWSEEVLKSDRDSVELRRAREILPIMETVDLLLDIHSMQKPSRPMMMAGPLAKGRTLAKAIGIPELVITDGGHAAGKRMRDFNGFGDPQSPRNAALIECGQHWEKGAGDLAIEFAVRFLRATGTTADGFGDGIGRNAPPRQRFVEVTDAITIQSDRFVFAQPFLGAEVIESKGTLIGHDGDASVVTPHDHCILIMPSMRLWRGQTALRFGRFVQEPQ